MPVLAIFSTTFTKAQYDLVRSQVDQQNESPAGAIFHAASVDEHGHIHVAEVWESGEALDQFVSTQLMPLVQRNNLQPPQVSVYPTHLIRSYPALEPYRSGTAGAAQVS